MSGASEGAAARCADKEILFVADPMCSWCWGFSPVIAAIDEAVRGRALITLVVGGLRPGTREPMNARAKAEVRHHWEEVGRATGQPFTFDFFARDGFVYDTEPACRAAVTAREIEPAATLTYLEALHRAFYVEGRDVTEAGVLATLAEDFGIDSEAFAAAFASADTAKATVADFHLARRLGVSGFPTLIVNDRRGYAYLTVGYRPFADLAPSIEAWLKR